MDEKLRALIASSLKLSPDEAQRLTEKDSTLTIKKWDSLGHVKLIADLEKAYGRSIPFKEAIKLIQIEKIILFLKTT